MVKLISLDTSSSRTGWALFIDGEYNSSGVIDYKKYKKSDRYQQMCMSIVSVLDKHKPDIIVVEELSVNRNMATTRILAKIIGAMFFYATFNKIEYNEIKPSVWRKLIGLKKNKGESYKDSAISYVYKLYNKKVVDDEADAICIGLALCNIRR